jgi:hypothetical protein
LIAHEDVLVLAAKTDPADPAGEADASPSGSGERRGAARCLPQSKPSPAGAAT